MDLFISFNTPLKRGQLAAHMPFYFYRCERQTMGDSFNHEEEGEGERRIVNDDSEPNMLLQVSSCLYLFIDGSATRNCWVCLLVTLLLVKEQIANTKYLTQLTKVIL